MLGRSTGAAPAGCVAALAGPEAATRGDKIACDTKVLWGDRGVVQRLFKPLDLWQAQCSASVTGEAIPAGHFIPEECPELTATALRTFMR